VTDRPATVTVVERDLVDVLGETWNVTVPLPVSGDPPAMLTQLALSLAVQLQLERLAVTLTAT
jgi:hypothetical protein